MIAAVLSGLMVPASAIGSRVAVVSTGDCKYECDSAIAFDASPGERNDVRIAANADSVPTGTFAFTITDAGAPLTVGSQCVSRGAHSATCTAFNTEVGFFTGFLVHFGRGDHALDASSVSSTVDVWDGPGNNQLRTGSADDTFHVGPGSTYIDGGAGSNTAVFAGAVRRLRVNLASSAMQGGRGVRVALHNIQNVEAVRASGAVLRGNAGPNSLEAGAGSWVYGGRGKNELYAGSGGHLFGGPGADELSGDAHDRGPPRVFSCGSPQNLVFDTKTTDIVRANCQTVNADGGSLNQFVKLVGRPRPNQPFAILEYGCETQDNCPVSLIARAGSLSGPVVALRRFYVRYAHRYTTYRRYALRLNAAGRAELRHLGRLRVVLYYEQGPYRSGVKFTPPVGFTTILHR